MANGENFSNWINNIGGALSNFSYEAPEPQVQDIQTKSEAPNQFNMVYLGVAALLVFFMARK